MDFTPEPGLSLAGQMHHRVGEQALDPLMAVAAFFGGDEGAVALVSVDICVLGNEFARETASLFSRETGLPEESLLIHATHTHAAPAVTPLLEAEPDPAFRDRVQSAILSAACTAVRSSRPAEVFSGTASLDGPGFNRRGMFADGTSRMYGHSQSPGYVGLEGPRDPALPVIWAKDETGNIAGMVIGFSTHPTSLEAIWAYSADIPGAVRRWIQDHVGWPIPVVYMTGPAGNTSPMLLDPWDERRPFSGDDGLARCGCVIGNAALSKALGTESKPIGCPAVRCRTERLQIPIRPWPGPGDPTWPHPWDSAAAAYYEISRTDWDRRTREENPVEVRVHAVRIGDTAICTSPAELFVEHGLAIRKDSPARTTLLAELTDGYVGYMPTRLAFDRGGYETWPAPSSQLIPDAGDLVVRSTVRMLRQLWDE